MAKILYVDPDAERAALICRLFGQRGHTVTVTSLAERAMIFVHKETDFDVVVLRLILPGIDGAEMCRWLQRWSALPSVPRVVFTDPDTHLRLNLTGGLPHWLPADKYIHGLQDPQELVEAVEHLLAARQAGGV